MESLTIHNLPSEIAQALQQESVRLNASLEDTVIELLRRALKIGISEEKRNGLARLAGTWTAEEHAQFEAAIAVTEQ
ncbi:MAG TPA: hypothetical protein VGM86_06220 [Thermoanaerobaculia bacterium]|jgi:plasmid stability protein